MQNIFRSRDALKQWAMDLSDACGSQIVNRPPDVKKIDELIEEFVSDYNINMQLMNEDRSGKEEE
tara:strand:+ start:223 stop:417 length:195 start_codon:yes stop_codon:yes gene_type:complete